MTSAGDERIAAARWTAAERESFFSAIARHRRASWRVTLAAAFATAVVAVVVAVLLSPLLYCTAGLVLDLVNRLRPAPDLIGASVRLLRPLLAAPRAVPLMVWARVTLLAAAPGLVLLALSALGLRRMLSDAAWFASGEVPGRAPDRSRLAEQRFANVVEEMCLAAQLPPPRIRVLEAAGANAAALGRDERHATIVVGAPLLELLNREQLEGVAGHLVGAIANGDLAIGLRTAVTLALFNLLGRLSEALTDRRPLGRLLSLGVAFAAPRGAAAQRLAAEIAAPFGAEQGRAPAAGPSGRSWRDWLVLPMAGPVMIAGFFSAFVAALLLAPVIALAWRQRKYLADATAVRLTRDPDGLAGALQVLAAARTGAGLTPWAAHLALLPGPGGGLLGGSVVPLFPGLARRERSLRALGAHVVPGRIGLPRAAWLFIAALAALLAPACGVVVYLLLVLSVAMSGMFLVVPAAILHAILR